MSLFLLASGACGRRATLIVFPEEELVMARPGGIVLPPASRSTGDRPAFLGEAQAGERLARLGELKAALEALGVDCVLASRRTLRLGFDEHRAGMTDPELYIRDAGSRRVCEVITTDGEGYSLRERRVSFSRSDIREVMRSFGREAGAAPACAESGDA